MEAGQFLSVRNGLDTLLITDQKLYLMKPDGMVSLDGFRASANF
jgi:hypothetical protein